MILREELAEDILAEKLIKQKKLEDFPISKELFACLENKDYYKSFELIREQLYKETDSIHWHEYAAINALWSTYLYENGHKDFLSSLDNAPEFCFAFSNIKEIYIPASIEYIPYSFCKGCRKIQKITVDEKNDHYDSRDNCNAIITSEDNHMLLACKNTTLLKSIKSVEWNAFNFLSKDSNKLSFYKDGYYLGVPGNPYFLLVKVKSNRIKECTINPSCKVIRPGLFYKCKSLKEIEMPESVEIIPYGLFSECTNLRKIKMHDHIKEIGYDAFEGCYSLKVLEIPKGVKRLDGDVLDETYIETLILNKGLKSIDLGCLGLSCPKEIVYKGTFNQYDKIINSFMWLEGKWVFIIASDEMHYVKRSLIWGDFDKEEELKYREDLIERLGEDPWK